MAILPSELDRYGSRVISVAALSREPSAFVADLTESIEVWRGEGVPLVWLTLPLGRAEFVPLAVDSGFVYHHASPEDVTLTLSLQTGAYVPPFATHYVGAGGVVIRDERELLVVQELHHTRKHYKLPGGMLNHGEHIADAVRREIKEETNIDTEFLSLVCFRHWHGYRFDRSDIYFICRLEPTSFDITPQPGEIAECLWMDVDEYLCHPDVHAFNRRVVQAAMDSDGLIAEEIVGYGSRETHEYMVPRPTEEQSRRWC